MCLQTDARAHTLTCTNIVDFYYNSLIMFKYYFTLVLCLNWFYYHFLFQLYMC